VVLLAVLVRRPDPEPTAAPTATAEARALHLWAKLQLARDVAASRRNLMEAAALFGALERRPPAPLPVLEPDPAVPAAERLCVEVIDWVARQLSERPAERMAAVARLEAELRQARDQPGGVRLPDPDAGQLEDLLDRTRARLGLARAP
jgi:hypothetical protein